MPVEIDLLSVERGTITAPAGCGKTHLIADALTRHGEPKPILVLTHTNAGVAALRAKLERASVPSSRYRLATIDGWAIRLVKTFPARSGIAPAILELRNRGADYPTIRDSAWRLLRDGHIKDILAATYDRLIVDEYQDCSARQHAIVYYAAQTLRTCVLGDPMQAIFGFGTDQLADWERHVCQHFPIVGQLQIPQRWARVGEEAFGRWLLQIREHLARGGALDLASIPPNVSWIRLPGDQRDHEIRLAAGRTSAGADEKALVIADTRPASQRDFAKQIPGAVTVENVDLTDLIDFSDRFDLSSTHALRHLVEFAGSVMTNVGSADMLARVDSLRAGRARREASEAESAAIRFTENPSYSAATAVLNTIAAQSGVRNHRPAILRGAYNMLKSCEASPGMAPGEAATIVREQSRLIGRPLAKRTVGSTLLLKGLEAEICVILNPELMDRRHLYVAMTRGAKRLLICSQHQQIRPQ
ncbi:UvrD-helicase domain-containing protein [Aminobacter ciceronei]|uniref:DNA 3'-5' helicase II n=1 Tax=Aminobacter ciceronei TaxID=150723 RepID=A0ABR6C5Z7_9HYPH|nr:UvrD-helicase domain-containing protein [Aminobacter ciceronei]MBA8906457.1 DNA helicase-2/ATP-dependent DNA helicase PcrA [Aminobacter ciceronei]MBA9020417.1 DNA helicase-2/ATP-dependent DNA helicase PcrA [Aminobacter ciceronei]